jgi:hypothetical protein
MVGLTIFYEDEANISRDEDFRETRLMEEDIPFIQDELDNVTTILYVLIEGARNDLSGLEMVGSKLRVFFLLLHQTLNADFGSCADPWPCGIFHFYHCKIKMG